MAVGALAGVSAGMFGVGGGVVIVPSLLLFGLVETLAAANGASLAALLLPVGVFGVLAYHREGLVRWWTVAYVSSGLLIGAVGGAWLANALDRWNPILLQQLYGGFLAVIGWRMAAPLQWMGLREKSPEPPERTPDERPLPLIVLGLVAGVSAGLFGIGGGAVIVPILVTFLGFPQKTAVATSLGALLPPVGIGAAWVYYQNGNLSLPVVIPLACGLLLGTYFGARLTIGLPAARVKQIYGIFLLVNALRFIFTG
jgi:uncharacterized membrane protein YfcA